MKRIFALLLACVLLFTALDMMMHVDVLGWLPVDARNALDACGVVKMGVTELFALLFILYEATSVLKNMLLCGLPVPARSASIRGEILAPTNPIDIAPAPSNAGA